MITRKHWDRYIYDLSQFKAAGFDLYVNDDRIVQVSVADGAFWTASYRKTADGKFERAKFTFEGSVNRYMTLEEIYNKVTFRARLGDIRHKAIDEERMFNRVASTGRPI